MFQSRVMQGRKITSLEVDFIRDLIRKNRECGRSRLSQELCRHWNWRNAQGRINDMAARTLLLKLHRSAIIELPPSQHSKARRYQPYDVSILRSAEPISGSLDHLRPLCVDVVTSGSEDGRLFNSLLVHEHYLGHRRSGLWKTNSPKTRTTAVNHLPATVTKSPPRRACAKKGSANQVASLATPATRSGGWANPTIPRCIRSYIASAAGAPWPNSAPALWKSGKSTTFRPCG